MKKITYDGKTFEIYDDFETKDCPGCASEKDLCFEHQKLEKYVSEKFDFGSPEYFNELKKYGIE